MTEVRKPVSMMERFNKNNIFDIDTKNFKYVDLKILYDTDPTKQYKVLGFFTTNKGKYGKEAVAIIENYLVNLPKHILKSVEEMLDDDEVIEYIKSGHVAFKVYEYHSNTYDKDCYSVTWLDI